VLRAIEPDYLLIVESPDDRALVAEIKRRGIKTFLYALGRYRSVQKSIADMMNLPRVLTRAPSRHFKLCCLLDALLKL